MFLTGWVKNRLTRSEKRGERRVRQEERGITKSGTEEQPVVVRHNLDITQAELQELQDSDPTLEAIRESADEHPSTSGIGLFRRDGLLYRRSRSRY